MAKRQPLRPLPPRCARAPRAHRAPLTLLAAALALAGLVPATTAAQPAAGVSAEQAIRQYAIAPGALSTVLGSYAATAGVELAVDASLLQGRQSAGLAGRHTIEEGFAALLRGHGLRAARQANGSYTIQADPAAGAGVAALAPVTVTGSAPAEITEDTGAYTTGISRGATGLGLTLRQTPQSISVMTRQRLDDLGVQSVQEVLRHAPGITTTQLDSERYSFYSRGFSIDNFQHDGVPTQFNSAYAAGETEVDSVLYDRVEILRGATGLLTGAGEPSAAINLVRKRAHAKTFTGTLTAGAASWDNYRVSADLSTPLSENGRLRGRLVAAHEDKHGFVDGYERRRQSVYGVIDADLTEATTVSLGASHQQSRARGVTYGGFPLVYSDGSPIDWRSRGRSFSIWPHWSSEETDSDNVFAQLDHRWANGWTTTALAMYSRQEVDNARLFSWGFPDPATGIMSSNPSRVRFPGARTQRSVDIKSSGPFQALGREHELIVGLSTSRQESDFDRTGAADTAPSIGLFDWAAYPAPAAWGARVKSETYARRQHGVYGAARLSLSDPLTLIVGGRYNRWDRSGAAYMGRNPYDYQQDKFTPYAGLVFDMTPATSLYASYTRIYNPQNFRDRNGDFLDPLSGENWEAGVKRDWLDGRLQGSLAVFRIRQDNVATVDPGQFVPGTANQAYVGDPGVTSKGIEVELNGEPAEGWNVSFNATHFKATNAAGARASTASPRTSARVFTTYRLPGDWHRLTIGGGLAWQSKVTNVTGVYHADNPNGPGEYRQGAYVLANLMARYQFDPRLSLQVNVDNLFDKWYYSAVNFNEQIAWGTPRSYRATLTYKF